ncbi:MAG: hypothetical protein ACOX3H_00185 [Saccharofermentanales bacterium]
MKKNKLSVVLLALIMVFSLMACNKKADDSDLKARNGREDAEKTDATESEKAEESEKVTESEEVKESEEVAETEDVTETEEVAETEKTESEESEAAEETTKETEKTEVEETEKTEVEETAETEAEDADENKAEDEDVDKTEDEDADKTEAEDVDKTEEINTDQASPGEIYETEEFSVSVPEGWFAFPSIDADGVESTKTVSLMKGTEDPFEAMDAPGINLSYGGPDLILMEVDKKYYDESEDLDPIEIGGKSFTGFTGKSYGRSLTYLFAVDGDLEYQVTIWTETPRGKISLEDADVIQIIESFQGK